ncbi:MAG: hypothetical protein HQ565_10580 [Bacteroidetes bacterium]|nr:hypothetical protein [Bacteroidota bacterium]
MYFKEKLLIFVCCVYKEFEIKYTTIKKINLLTLILLFSTVVFAQTNITSNVKENKGEEQETEKIEIKKIFDLGFGIGLDYGGLIGAKATFIPIKYLGIFVSAGYHLVSFGWQIGVTGYFLPKTNMKKIRPYAKVMYGSNRVIIVEGASQHNKNYIGLTPGVGLEFRFGAQASHGLNIDLNFPIGSSEFKDDFDALDKNPMIEITNPLPIAISLGYHFEF